MDVGGVIAVVVVTTGYFLPTLVAICRSKRNTFAIFVLNLLSAWSVVGWVLALVWACTRDGPSSW
jgi:hypothetical protein